MASGQALSPQESAELQLREDIGSFALDPLRHAMYAYTWGEGDLSGVDGPREWQKEVMRDIRDHLRRC